MNDIQFCDLKILEESEFHIVGDGQYVASLYKLLVDTGRRLPTCIYVREYNPDLPMSIQRPEGDIAKLEQGILVLGTNAFQQEMANRVNQYENENVKLVDLRLGKGASYASKLYSEELPNETKHFVVFYALNPVENIDCYLKAFFKQLEAHEVKVLIRHPMQKVADDLLKNALAVMVWCGGMKIHQSVISKCSDLGIIPTYLECGFFPQKDYFYFDKLGANFQSQLKFDDLSWVKKKHYELLEETKRKFFMGVEKYNEEGYVFSPLQVPNDSNVLMNSCFKGGMQDFIDFIEYRYQDKDILFKVHPKDRFKDSYIFRKGRVVDADSRSLIMSADIVHGINSSVLFESALYGKETYAEGDCLLNAHKNSRQKLLAAMVYRQFDSLQELVDVDKLKRFSNFSVKLYELLGYRLGSQLL